MSASIPDYFQQIQQSLNHFSKTQSPLSSLPQGQVKGMSLLAQINVSPGDLAKNATKIQQAIQVGTHLDADLVLFPELCLMGYPVRDLIIRFPFLVEENLKWLKALAESTQETFALVGFVEPRCSLSTEKKRTGKPYWNSVALLGQGKIQAIFRKSLLPEYGEFEDYRQFEAAAECGAIGPEWLGMAEPNPPLLNGNGLISIRGKQYAVSICEDLWGDSEFFETPDHTQNPLHALLSHQPDALINISASPSRCRKEGVRDQLCRFMAKKYSVPLVYVNQVGTVDEVAFDGASRAYDSQGQLFARAKAFEEQYLLVDAFNTQGQIAPLPNGNLTPEEIPKAFIAGHPQDLARTYLCLRQGIRDYFEKVGFQRAVLGLSGGLDSSVTVVLLADALGPENVLGVSMPSPITPNDNKQDAYQLASNLGIQWLEIPIKTITAAFQAELQTAIPQLISVWGQQDNTSNAQDNIQAISRATILRQLGNEFKALPVATSDKSEFYLGYATVNGDMSGALAPLGDLPKTKVRALAHWMNTHRHAYLPNASPQEIIPNTIIQKPSGADLKTDPVSGRLIGAEEELMPYEFADEIIWRIETLHQSLSEMQTTPFVYESHHVLTSEQKAEWLHKFFARLPRAVFKWFIAPPILMNESNGSIAKTDYHHPIVANRIRWQGHTVDEIKDVLQSEQHVL